VRIRDIPRIHLLTLLVIYFVSGCGNGAWNNPYPAAEHDKNIYYSSFSERPKHFDPARSYSSNEYAFIGQIYEPPLQYHYLKRPYELIPLTSTQVPQPVFFDRDGNKLAADADPSTVAKSVYTIQIRPGIKYQPHPAFAKKQDGDFYYLNLHESDLDNINQLSDFKFSGSRELTAYDYVHQMKRLAHPGIHSPILGVIGEYIPGLKTLADELRVKTKSFSGEFLDLREFNLDGVEVVDQYTYRITIDGVYPQLVYWLAMPFFSPMPWEADKFYAQPGFKEKNISLNWYPVGTGAYMLTVNNPNRQMVLEQNPNYRGEVYPSVGAAGDEAAGLLLDAGKKMPFINKVIYSLEKENIPYWNKFLQGFYDTSGISSESFDQAIQFSSDGEAGLTPEMQQKKIRLVTTVATSIYYFGFNMRDSVVGGLDDRARKLRQAISIAIDFDEFISIFANGRGIPAQGPIPPGIFGYREQQSGVNPVVYNWVNDKPQRKSIEDAKKLLADAGYPNGIDQKTGKPLTLHLDITASGPDDKARLNWYRKQFQKINVQLVIRNTMYNRFQEKMLKGTAQIFIWGWNADYPDPENFLFLLYGPNSKVASNGENAANYQNPEFDRLFDIMKNMPNGDERQSIIDQMMDIVRHDTPWIFGFHPKKFGLYQQWFLNAKPNLMSHNTMQYKRIDPILRMQQREHWNPPITWPIWIVGIIFVLATIPAMITYRKREHTVTRRKLSEVG